MKIKVLILAAMFGILVIPSGLTGSMRNTEPCKADDYSTEAENCTSILVTKNASVDGSVMTSHSCDGGFEFRSNVVPGKTHRVGQIRTVYKGGGRGEEQAR